MVQGVLGGNSLDFGQCVCLYALHYTRPSDRQSMLCPSITSSTPWFLGEDDDVTTIAGHPCLAVSWLSVECSWDVQEPYGPCGRKVVEIANDAVQ